jgi:peptidyl-prolyl cis-trans isomerase B (cyclophilin B)
LTIPAFAIFLVASACSAQAPDFKAATRPPYTPEPERSINGKSLAEMKAKVEKLWPEIVFEKDGKPVEYTVVFKTEVGDIEIEFFPKEAPNHVRSFVALSKVGYMDGTIFHRTIPNFVIQGGSSTGLSAGGGPGYCLKPEFNNRPHNRGALSMARAQPPDSAGSQFFICHGSPRGLDRQYTVFGQVKSGLDVVDKIVARPTGAEDRPFEPVKVTEVKVLVNGKAD